MVANATIRCHDEVSKNAAFLDPERGSLPTLLAAGSTMAQTAQVFRLDGGNSTYAFGVNEHGDLQPLYWGARDKKFQRNKFGTSTRIYLAIFAEKPMALHKRRFPVGGGSRKLPRRPRP